MGEKMNERLRKRRKKIAEKSSGRGIIYPKEGTIRFRVLKPIADAKGEDQDWAIEVTNFYLGANIKGVLSRRSLGEDCILQERYDEAKANKKEVELAKALSPRNKWLVPVVIYEDERGKKVDEEKSGMFLFVTPTIYGEMIDAFLDPDWMDFTDPEDGYDFKLKRTGSGMTDTTYSITNMKNSSLPKKWTKPVDIQKMLEGVILSEEEVENNLAQFLNEFDADEEPEPKKKKNKKRKRKDDTD